MDNQVSTERTPLIVDNFRAESSEVGSDASFSAERVAPSEAEREAMAESAISHERAAATGEDTEESISADPEDSQERVEASSEDEEVAEQHAEEVTPTVERVLITDDKGQREVEIDLSNKDEVLNHIKRSYGMNKFRAERDNFKKLIEENQPKLQQYDTLQKAYEDDGLEGVVNILTEGKFEDFKQEIINEYEVYRFASEEERRILDQQKQLTKTNKEASKWKAEFEKFKQKQDEEKMQLETEKVTNMTTAVFNKHRFDGKLGNPAQEAKLDKLLFTSLRTELAEKAEAGEEITSELVESIVQDYATALKSTIKQEVANKTAKLVDNKKQQATKTAQKLVTTKMKNASVDEEYEKAKRSGDIEGMMSRLLFR